MVLLGVLLGFLKSGECGSVFQPRDDSRDLTIGLLGGGPPPDCSTALDLTLPVWILVGTGVVLVIVGLIAANPQDTADTHEESPSGNSAP